MEKENQRVVVPFDFYGSKTAAVWTARPRIPTRGQCFEACCETLISSYIFSYIYVALVLISKVITLRSCKITLVNQT